MNCGKETSGASALAQMCVAHAVMVGTAILCRQVFLLLKRVGTKPNSFVTS